MRLSMEEAAHDQPVVYVEGRSDNHPEADALVHVQLTCGLANYRVNRLLQNSDAVLTACGPYWPSRPDFRGRCRPPVQQS